MASTLTSPKKTVHLKDLAEITGLSQTAVSRALRDKQDIGPVTKRRVKDLAAKLHYRPHAAARSLAVGRTWTIGLANTDFSNPLYNNITIEVGREAEKAGYSLLLYVTSASPSDIDEQTSFLTTKNCDGIIFLAPTAAIASIKDLRQKKQEPFVIFGLPEKSPDLNMVMVDREISVCRAIRHFAALGHSRFAYLCLCNVHRNADVLTKHKGFCRGLTECGLPVRNEWVMEGLGTMESGYEVTRQLTRRKILPSIVFYHNDLAAMGGLHALHDAGLRVPEDVSVLGFDDIPMAAHTVPPLTTIGYSISTVAQHLVRIMSASIEKPERTPEQLIMMPHLIERASTGPRRAGRNTI